MPRETKFSYGFLLVGTGVPYLIDKVFGLAWAIGVSVACVLFGLAFLIAGLFHPKVVEHVKKHVAKQEPKKK